MSQEIDNAVDQFLAANEITFSTLYLGLGEMQNGSGKPMDRWNCAFKLRDGRAALEGFEFFTGLGLRAPATPQQKRDATWGFPGLTENDRKGLTSYGKRYLQKLESLRKPQAPSAASVLNSIILDSGAADQSFASWCADFGYDTDSRKAYATYEACQQNADKLRRVFKPDQIRALSEMLQDY